MGAIERVYVSGFRCDRRGCAATYEGEEMPRFVGYNRYKDWAAERGWTFWAGNRCFRSYCPDHGPSSGSNLHNVTPKVTFISLSEVGGPPSADRP